MWIKLCANTSAEDAHLAADAGADALGFVFAPSPRRVTPEQAAVIGRDLPNDPTRIGVFLTGDFDEIAASIRSGHLHGTQLHGALDLRLIENFRSRFGETHFLIQTLHWDLEADPSATEQTLRHQLRALSREGTIDAVLLDAKTAAASGGTGKSFNWTRAREVISAESSGLRIILAGGLTPENVTEAILTLRPWGVDVASGVEASPGRKDPSRVHAFLRAARTAFAAIESPSLPTGAARSM